MFVTEGMENIAGHDKSASREHSDWGQQCFRRQLCPNIWIFLCLTRFKRRLLQSLIFIVDSIQVFILCMNFS